MVQIASFICDNGNELRLSVLCVLEGHFNLGRFGKRFRLLSTTQDSVGCDVPHIGLLCTAKPPGSGRSPRLTSILHLIGLTVQQTQGGTHSPQTGLH